MLDLSEIRMSNLNFIKTVGYKWVLGEKIENIEFQWIVPVGFRPN